MERLPLTQVWKEGRGLGGWSWERAFPGRGVAVGTPAPGESRGKSALGRRMAVSGVLSYKGGEREGRKEKGVPGEFQREREWFPPSEVGEQI